jgi:hypothetical protein
MPSTGRLHGDDLPPLDDPYLTQPERTPRAAVSRLALASLISAFLGPVGAICAIVFGWIARREIERGEARAGRGLATAGLTLGVMLTMAWGGALGLLVWHRHREAPVAEADLTSGPAEPATPRDDPNASTPNPSPATTADPRPGGSVPKTTKLAREGAVTVVDVGVNVSSLQDELARQRAEAATVGETVLLMTTRSGCAPCEGVERSLKDPMMQTALTKVRLVRVDIEVFRDDLEAMKVPRKYIPGFYLLSLDLTPRDGINGGEWEEDIPPNIAPVLGAFVRGKYTARKQVWQPLPGSGIKL